MVLSSTQMEAGDARFSDLLQPIRDLAKNWDVDIASYLEDYLEELESVTITFDGGHTTMNFAQAAMLVQGSACVYSKKVEYLYSLVYQVLDMLANKKKQGKSSVDQEGNDADANFQNDNPDEEFLSLDDLPEGKNMTMKEGDRAPDKTIQLIPQMPLSLIPLEEGEKGENPLLSKTGEVLASRNDFKLNTSCIHPCGTLLLDMSHLDLLEQSLKALASSTPYPTKQTEARTQGNVGDNDTPVVDDLMPPPPDATIDGDGGFDEVDGGPPGGEEMDIDPEVNAGGDGLRRSERQVKKTVIVSKPVKPYVDPWRVCDPHEEGKSVLKPFRRGVCYRVLPGLEDQKSKKRKRNTKKKMAEKPLPLTEFVQQAFFSHKSKFTKNPLKVTTFSDLEDLYWKEFKKRQSLYKEQKKQALLEVEEEEEEEAENEVGGDNFEDDGQPLAAMDGAEDDNDGAPMMENNLSLAIERGLESRQLFAASFQQLDAVPVEEGVLINSYEELVRHHVEKYMASAQEYAQITELSRRVSEWEDKIIPRLAEEDTHEPFDINRYGSKIIDNLNKGTTIPFRRLVANKPDFEICRIFLASLMLANTTNIRIEERGTLSEGMDKFEVELLSTKRHFEELAEYQAPSITGQS